MDLVPLFAEAGHSSIPFGEYDSHFRTDPLTQIANRRTFDRTLRKMVASALQSGASLSLAMVDIDNFKAVNDTHGHQIGAAR